jgi:hypothetical protein
LNFSDPDPGAGLSTGAFAVDNGEMSFGSGVTASASMMLVAPANGSMATLNVSSGANVSISGPTTVANQNGSFGTINVSSEGTLSTNQFSLGAHIAGGTDGVGMLNVSGDFISNGGKIEGYSAYGESTATIDGSGALWDATNGGTELDIGLTSQGEVVVSDDGALSTDRAELCTNGGQGSVIVNTGASWTDSVEITIGGGAAAPNQQPSTSYVAVTGWDARGLASSISAKDITVGAFVNGQLIVDAGTSVSASGNVHVSFFGKAPNCEVDIMQGATLTSASATISGVLGGTTLVYIDGGVWQTTDAQTPFIFGVGQACITFDKVNSGEIDAPGGFQDLGGGTMLLGPGIIFSGLTFQADGGTISPGSSTSSTNGLATLSVQGDIDASAGFEFDANLGSAGNSDRLSITGNATLGGDFYATSLVDAATYTWGDGFTVLTASTITGQFANLPAGFYDGGSALPQLRSGYMWYVSYSAGQLSLAVMGPPESMGIQDVYDHAYQSGVSGTLEALDNPMVPVTYQIVTEPQYGTVTLNPSTGAFTYTSTTAAPFDAFSFDATDAEGTGNVASVQLYDRGYYVGGGYLDPFPGEWLDSRLSTPAGQTLTVGAGDPGDPIPAGDYPTMSSQLVAGEGPQHAGSFTLNPDGTFSYTPAAAFSGIDWFTYQVTDVFLQCGYATVFIDVTSQNNPSALPANITASPGAAYTYDPTTNDLTLSSGTLTFTTDTTSGPLVNLTAAGSDSNVIFASSQYLAGLTLVGGATATMQSLGAARTASNHNVLVVGSLGASSDPVFTVSSSSKLDLEDNDLIVHTGSSDTNGASEYATVEGLAALGRNPASGAPGNPDGQWNGNGLNSSAASAADAAAGYEQIGLGVVVNSTLAEGPLSSWQVGSFNETLGTNDIIVKYDYLGDYALEGSVNADDAGILQIEYDNGATNTHTWATGSSMGNGLADANEAGLFQIQYGLGTGGNLGPQL